MGEKRDPITQISLLLPPPLPLREEKDTPHIHIHSAPFLKKKSHPAPTHYTPRHKRGLKLPKKRNLASSGFQCRGLLPGMGGNNKTNSITARLNNERDSGVFERERKFLPFIFP